MMLAALLFAPASAGAAGPTPGTPEYVQRDNQNIADAYGRQTGPDGQLSNPAYAPALIAERQPRSTSSSSPSRRPTPTRPALTPGNVFPGWNGGNPLPPRLDRARAGMRDAGLVHQPLRRADPRRRVRAAAGRARSVHRQDAHAARSRAS